MYGNADNGTLTLLLQSVGLPALTSLAGALLLLYLGRRRGWRLPAGGAALVLAGFWSAVTWIEGRFSLPPERALDVLPLFGLAGVVLDSCRQGAWQRWADRLAPLLALVLGGWMLLPVLQRLSWSAVVIQLGAIGVIYGVLQVLLRQPQNARDRLTLLMAMAGIMAPVIALGGSLKLGQMTGALAAALGGLWLLETLGMPVPGSRDRSATPFQHTGLMLLVALGVAAYQYADVAPLPLVLVAGLPLLAWLSGSLGHALTPRRLSMRNLALALIPLLASIWLVWPEEALY